MGMAVDVETRQPVIGNVPVEIFMLELCPFLRA